MSVAVIMGSQSDWTVMQEAVQFLQTMDIPVDVHVLSAHRTPERMAEFAQNAEAQGYQVIIAGAGGAAHLPGMTAAYTTLPVIGVPVPSKHLAGMDSLLSIVQMPGGIPVATVAVGQAKNAGILAAQIIALSQPRVRERLHQYRATLKAEVLHSEETVKIAAQKGFGGQNE
ncbi:MAG: 5-(carboxyamino)imidazole ribonucleotide mutase [Sulfobacillus thermosulfidooxidans]|nr:5-(carboxyamino)imidazole ribonucleotide mutase [Sulfobacillus thermotolerans]PSR35815.1 MAG: 5-(carboxyamino)imidazole ribonucleotide mutase [Sulfobacillus thermosulfidooxidans]